MVKCQLQCQSAKVFVVEIDTISKSTIVKNMLEGIGVLLHNLIFLFNAYAYFKPNVNWASNVLHFQFCNVNLLSVIW